MDFTVIGSINCITEVNLLFLTTCEVLNGIANVCISIFSPVMYIAAPINEGII